MRPGQADNFVEIASLVADSNLFFPAKTWNESGPRKKVCPHLPSDAHNVAPR